MHTHVGTTGHRRSLDLEVERVTRGRAQLPVTSDPSRFGLNGVRLSRGFTLDGRRPLERLSSTWSLSGGARTYALAPLGARTAATAARCRYQRPSAAPRHGPRQGQRAAIGSGQTSCNARAGALPVQCRIPCALRWIIRSCEGALTPSWAAFIYAYACNKITGFTSTRDPASVASLRTAGM